jgi:hypothetical protein
VKVIGMFDTLTETSLPSGTSILLFSPASQVIAARIRSALLATPPVK